MSNHRWKDNTCTHCAITRVKKYWKLLMAITDQPPYNHYKTGTDWWYGHSYKFKRPDCKKTLTDE